jgi:hypothetical protein
MMAIASVFLELKWWYRAPLAAPAQPCGRVPDLAEKIHRGINDFGG